MGPEINTRRWELDSWLKHLLIASTELKCCEMERLFIEVALRYLYTEAKNNRDRRDHASIRRVWILAHPYLEKHQLLNPFKGDVYLKNSLNFFVRNDFF